MKAKIIAIGSVLSVASALSVVACGTAQSTSSSAEIKFKEASQVQTNDTLSAASGSSFSATNTSYENAGNENTTTRAGLRVRKAAVISAIENNLGLNSENKVMDMDKFLAAINKLLPESSALKKEDFTNLDTVEITLGADSTKTKLFDDIVPSSKKSPIITQMVNIVLRAKDGQTIGTQKVNTLRLNGMQKIRLTDYRRVDITTLEAATNNPTITLATALKPTSSITLTSLAEALNKHFDITDKKFATPFFPIWNEKDGENNHEPLFEAAVKHSLSSAQVDDLLKLYKGKDAAKSHGDFPRPRVERAIQKVWFSVPTGATGSTVITETNNTYSVTLNLNMDFIKHWSWGSTAYSDFVKTFTLPVTFKVAFK